MSIFIKKDFISHAGMSLDFKIECDNLTDEDIETLAYIISKEVKFRDVIGIPTGGIRLQNALEKYKIESSILPIIIVDDVLTTGKSMKEYKKKYNADYGYVIFSRAKRLPSWIGAIFRM
jgi:hypoxanthine phosphoribosyltransferase